MKVIKPIGLTSLITSYVLMLDVFRTAYMNGIDGYGYKTTVYINNYGEAHIELIIILILLPITIIYLYNTIKEK